MWGHLPESQSLAETEPWNKTMISRMPANVQQNGPVEHPSLEKKKKEKLSTLSYLCNTSSDILQSCQINKIALTS